MTKLNLHLAFNGNCREAFQFYEKHLDGKVRFMMTWGESPLADKVPFEWSDKLSHASLSLGDQELSGADEPGASYQVPQGFSITLNIYETSEAERIFATLSEGGSIKMPLTETFWASRFGMLTDRFGIPWMINCGGPT